MNEDITRVFRGCVWPDACTPGGAHQNAGQQPNTFARTLPVLKLASLVAFFSVLIWGTTLFFLEVPSYFLTTLIT